MKLLLVRSLCVVLLAVPVFAQRNSGGGGNNGGTGGTGNRPPSNPTNPMPNTRTQPTFPEMDRPVFINGKVTLSDGSPLTEPAAIMTVCSTRRRIEGYTDSRGNFSFQLQKKSNTMGPQAAEMSTFGDETFMKGTSPSFQWSNCDILAVLAGFTSESVSLARYMPMMDSTDIGRIVLRPIANVDATVLSATSLAAPNDARKALEKARDQEKKKKLDDAAVSLQKAVELYPQYAMAWCELGRLQYLKRDTAGAQHSYEQAVAADPKYAKSYLGLAQLAFDAQQWQPLVDVTHKLLGMNSVNFPAAWFLNAVAHFNLQHFDEAEKSARDGLKADTEHRMPRMEYLLGVILYRKGDFTQSAEHARQFLKLTTAPEEIAEAQKLLTQVEQMSASAVVAAPEK